MSSSKKSFFSIPPGSGSYGSQSNTPRRNASSGNLRRASGSARKPEWHGTYESESAPTSRRGSASEDSAELGAKTPPLTPPLMKLTRVKVEGERDSLHALHPMHCFQIDVQAAETMHKMLAYVPDCDATLLCALPDRVKVVVRLRPAQPHETPGAVQVAEDGQHVLLERT